MSVQIISNEGAVQPPAFTPLLVNSINPMNFRNGLSQYLEFSKAALKASALSLFTYTFCYLFGLFHIYFLLSIHQLMEIPRIVVISSTSCYLFFGGGGGFLPRWQSIFPQMRNLLLSRNFELDPNNQVLYQSFPERIGGKCARNYHNLTSYRKSFKVYYTIQSFS